MAPRPATARTLKPDDFKLPHASCSMSPGVPLDLKREGKATEEGAPSRKRGRSNSSAWTLLLTPPQVFLHVPPNASPCKARLGCRSPMGRGGSTWPILSGCWSCSLPLSSGLSNGHEGAYNEILSNTILLSASHSTLQPWAQTPVGARALAAPASPSGLSAGDLPSCGIWDCPCEHIGTDRADTDDFLNLCESPCAASSNSSFL